MSRLYRTFGERAKLNFTIACDWVNRLMVKMTPRLVAVVACESVLEVRR